MLACSFKSESSESSQDINQIANSSSSDVSGHERKIVRPFTVLDVSRVQGLRAQCKTRIMHPDHG